MNDFAGFDDQASRDLAASCKILANAAKRFSVSGYDKGELSEITKILASGDLDKLKDYGFSPEEIKQLKDDPKLLQTTKLVTTKFEQNYTTVIIFNPRKVGTNPEYRSADYETFMSAASFYEGKGLAPHQQANSDYWKGKIGHFNPDAGARFLRDDIRVAATRYNSPTETLDAANRFIDILKEGLNPDVKVDGKEPTLTGLELEIVRRVLAGELKSVKQILEAYPGKHINLSSAALQKLIDLREKDPKLAKVGIVVTQQLQANKDLAHLSDDGPGVYGISKGDLALLQAPAGQAKAVDARNKVIDALNAKKGDLSTSSDNIATLAPGDKTQPAVPVLPDLQPGTESQGGIVKLTEEQTALVANLRIAINGPVIDGRVSINADKIREAMKDKPYRVQLQMWRQALREEGTPADQVNGMTEAQVRTAMRDRLMKVNPKLYFEIVKGGDPKLLQEDLALLETEEGKKNPIYVKFLNDEKAFVADLKKGPPKPVVPSNIKTPDEAKKISLDMLQTLSDVLNKDDKLTLTKDDIEKFQVLFGDDDDKAKEAMTALATKLKIDPKVLEAWRNDPAKKKVGAALFKWMERNQHQDDPISGIVTGDGEGISGKDLAKFLDAANSATINDSAVQGRAYKALNNYNIFASNTLPTLVDKPAVGAAPTYTDPGAYIMPGEKPPVTVLNGPTNLNSGILFPDQGGYKGGGGYYGGSGKTGYMLGGSPTTYSYYGNGDLGGYGLNSGGGYYPSSSGKHNYMLATYNKGF